MSSESPTYSEPRYSPVYRKVHWVKENSIPIAGAIIAVIALAVIAYYGK